MFLEIFPTTPNPHPNSFEIFTYDLIEFLVKKSFNILKLLHPSPNIMKPSQCTSPHQELSKDIKNMI
jgi:hypothetical protein